MVTRILNYLTLFAPIRSDLKEGYLYKWMEFLSTTNGFYTNT
uniref:Uncharacterized protein n=1 Tax=Ascaris lumbricoides TaxID=6252 RepID=A0A0M3ILP9_ASCLU